MPEKEPLVASSKIQLLGQKHRCNLLTTLKSYPAVLTPPRKGSPPVGPEGVDDVVDEEEVLVVVVLVLVLVTLAVPGRH